MKRIAEGPQGIHKEDYKLKMTGLVKKLRTDKYGEVTVDCNIIKKLQVPARVWVLDISYEQTRQHRLRASE